MVLHLVDALGGIQLVGPQGPRPEPPGHRSIDPEDTDRDIGIADDPDEQFHAIPVFLQQVAVEDDRIEPVQQLEHLGVEHEDVTLGEAVEEFGDEPVAAVPGSLRQSAEQRRRGTLQFVGIGEGDQEAANRGEPGLVGVAFDGPIRQVRRTAVDVRRRGRMPGAARADLGLETPPGLPLSPVAPKQRALLQKVDQRPDGSGTDGLDERVDGPEHQLE